ncbi:putative phospholipid-transporting ATPase VA [Bagarius yarrelli]|uniref:Putative phospholipid-transporting ATPase VA n=1 Tax=Bagarius yarrelli TaxID=175774 RepID=A0A556TRC9_BAGYA|nr:putative phospholipid-transporting ATPase VA [Bagarius yarrelli]
MAKYRKTKKRRLVVPSWISIEDTDGRQGTYSKNKIRTTKYTFLSFIPKNLFEQFHRFANIYFIFLAALNFVPIINAFQPEVGVIPICLVMSVTAVKDLWEDQRRRLSDRQANNLPCKLYNSKQQSYVERRWADVCVGDVVKLCCNEIIPADMVLLHTSDPKGVCHIETATWTRTNLKQRQVVKDLLQESHYASTHTSNTPSPSPAITPHQQHHIEVSDQNCDEDDNKDDNNEAKEEEEELLYEAESPDEAALVQAARAYGCTLLGRSPEQLLVALPGTGPLTGASASPTAVPL